MSKEKIKKVEPKTSTTKPYTIEVGQGKKKRQVVIVPEQIEDHEALSDRIWEMLERRGH